MQQNSRLHVPSLIQFIGSGLGILFALSAVAGMLAVGVMALVDGSFSNLETLAFFSMAWATGLVAVLVLPSLVLSFGRLIGRDIGSRIFSIPNGYRWAALLILIWPIFLVLGENISQWDNIAWLLLPPVQLLVVGIPLWWLVELGRRGLDSGSPQRNWGLFGFGLVITPAFIMVIELLVLGLLGFVFVLWLITQPELLDELTYLGQRLVDAQMNPGAVQRILQPYLERPVVIAGMIAVAAGIVPLVEELFKPLGVWILSLSNPSPVDGFVAGLLGGAAFALVESLGMLSTPVAQGWAILAIGRLGTAVLHTVTCALVGWGLASAWGKAHYVRLGIIFLLAVGMHALWNLLSMLLGLAPFISPLAGSDSFVGRLVIIAPLALISMGVIFFFLLIGANRKLRNRD